jgi:hypothetical protein
MTSSTPDVLALSAPIDTDFTWDRVEDIETTRTQVNGRCQDLLAVVGPPESQSLRIAAEQPSVLYRIEFLHRSVRDFLQQSDSVRRKLDEFAGPDFEADLTLLSCYVALLKRTTALSASYRTFGKLKHVWSTEALLHLRTIDFRHAPSASRLLHCLDKTMQCIYPNERRTHWSNVVSSRIVDPSSQLPKSNLAERGNRDLIGHLIEFGLTPYVKAALTGGTATKQGRPYLDYALRYDVKAGFRSDAQDSHLSQLSGDPGMVKMLLSLGCGVNEPIHIYGGRTVWDLYLAFLFDHEIKDKRYCETTWLLINHGAKPIKACIVGKQEQQTTDKYRDVTFCNTDLSMREILSSAFGEQEAEKMCERIARNGVDGRWWIWPAWSLWQSNDAVASDRGGARAISLDQEKDIS